ncbi:hypothetical protein HMPREF9946_02134 [Acetobacteraceae bacterium AT-5844]|nr:hypothetical protein HMPREF9946_02134 [Acetobacteraceae bacterium AT-5844]
MTTFSCLPSAKQTGTAMARKASFLPDHDYDREISQLVRSLGQEIEKAGAFVAPADLRSWMASVRSHAIAEVKRLSDPATRHPGGAA